MRAPCSAWQTQYATWKTRDLSKLELVYVWADGIDVKAGLESSKAALLVLIGGLADGTKVVLAVESGHRESTESWATVLRELTARGLCAPRCTIGDGALGLGGGGGPGVADQCGATLLESQAAQRRRKCQQAAPPNVQPFPSPSFSPCPERAAHRQGLPAEVGQGVWSRVP